MINFNEYKEKLKNSERLKLVLDLYKKGSLDLDEALEMIASDAQFYKDDMNKAVYIPYTNGGYAGSGTTTTTTTPWLYTQSTGAYVNSPTVTFTNGK